MPVLESVLYVSQISAVVNVQKCIAQRPAALQKLYGNGNQQTAKHCDPGKLQQFPLIAVSSQFIHHLRGHIETKVREKSFRDRAERLIQPKMRHHFIQEFHTAPEQSPFLRQCAFFRRIIP